MFGAFYYTYVNFSEEHAKEQIIKKKKLKKKTNLTKKETGNKSEKEDLIA